MKHGTYLGVILSCSVRNDVHVACPASRCSNRNKFHSPGAVREKRSRFLWCRDWGIGGGGSSSGNGRKTTLVTVHTSTNTDPCETHCVCSMSITSATPQQRGRRDRYTFPCTSVSISWSIFTSTSTCLHVYMHVYALEFVLCRHGSLTLFQCPPQLPAPWPFSFPP